MPFNNPALSSGGGFGNTNVVNPNVPVLVSAAVITPVDDVSRVTGTVPVATITPPNNYFNGPIYLFSTDATPFTTVTTGNIALATTITRYRMITLVYDPAVSLWYPSY